MDDYTFLCKIHRHKIYNYDNASKLEQDALDRLIKDGRLSYEYDESQKHWICKITSLGENYIYIEKQENRKWVFTTWISILSLVISCISLLANFLLPLVRMM